jgi:hypothetical protein
MPVDKTTLIESEHKVICCRLWNQDWCVPGMPNPNWVVAEFAYAHME